MHVHNEQPVRSIVLLLFTHLRTHRATRAPPAVRVVESCTNLSRVVARAAAKLMGLEIVRHYPAEAFMNQAHGTDRGNPPHIDAIGIEVRPALRRAHNGTARCVERPCPLGLRTRATGGWVIILHVRGGLRSFRYYSIDNNKKRPLAALSPQKTVDYRYVVTVIIMLTTSPGAGKLQICTNEGTDEFPQVTDVPPGYNIIVLPPSLKHLVRTLNPLE
jgi:hypothetical protein